jgi:hypothetical protein
LKKGDSIDMTQKIIDHLLSANGQKDDLEGLTLSLYNKEMKNLSKVITNTLSQLVSKGIIKQIKNHNGRRYFKLSDSFNNS